MRSKGNILRGGLVVAKLRRLERVREDLEFLFCRLQLMNVDRLGQAVV
jgi:hypothetical protein